VLVLFKRKYPTLSKAYPGTSKSLSGSVRYVRWESPILKQDIPHLARQVAEMGIRPDVMLKNSQPAEQEDKNPGMYALENIFQIKPI
jgi:hypothetical protein